MSGTQVMVILIVAIVMIASVLRAKHQRGGGRDVDPREHAENLRLREEVKELKERIQVLERITTEKENSLSREIEELRDR